MEFRNKALQIFRRVLGKEICICQVDILILVLSPVI